MQIEAAYLENLQQTYFDFLHANPEQKVLLIDCANIDFVNNPAHYQQIKELLSKEYAPGINHYHFLDEG
jgi:deoxyadenosine/deoxycytidine kinase